MTELIIMRHGEASWDAPSDPERELTPRGELCAANAGKYLSKIGWLPDVVISSPYTRARQTLAAVHQAFASVAIEVAPQLTPDNRLESVCEFLNSLPQERILIVSHQPLVGRLLGWLIEGDARAQPGMDTATMVLLSADGFVCGSADEVWRKTAAEVNLVL